MTLPVQPPTLPPPPAEYDRQYMDSLLNTLEGFIRLLNNPGELRGTTLNLSTLPSSPIGLEVGSVFELDGNLKVLREKDVYFDSPATATGSIGTVTTSP